MAKVAKRRNRYVLDFYDNQGRRQRKTMPVGTRKAEALEKLNLILKQINLGAYIPQDRIPTFKDVALEWLDHKKLNIRASTFYVYAGHTRNHFDDFLHLKINQINTQMIEQYISRRQKAGMNLSTLKKILVSLNQIFDLALKRGYSIVNPVTLAARPRGASDAGKEEIRVLKYDEIQRFLDHVTGQKYYVLFMLAVFTGARQGELLGLKWPDVEWSDKQIHIQRSYNNGRFYDTKTKGSNRRVDVGPATLKELKEWKLACPPGKLDLVFPTGTGRPINHSNLTTRIFKPALNSAGIKKIRFHDLRHTYASLLIDQGENIKYIQKQLGHSNPTVTLNVYAHLMEKTNQEAASKLEEKILYRSQNGHKN